MAQGYDNLDFEGSEGFVNEVQKAGAALKNQDDYLVAGSRYFIEGDNIELPTYAVRISNVVEWGAPMAGQYTRYVLVW